MQPSSVGLKVFFSGCGSIFCGFLASKDENFSQVQPMPSLKLDVLNEDYEENMKEIQRMHPRAIRPLLIACNYRTSAGQRKREKGDRMKISFPSEKQMIKTFVANLRRCKGCIRKGQSHFKDALFIASAIDSKECWHKAEAYHRQ